MVDMKLSFISFFIYSVCIFYSCNDHKFLTDCAPVICNDLAGLMKFHFSVPWNGDMLMVITLLLAPPYIIENSTACGLKFQMLKPQHILCTVGTIKKLLPCTLAPLFPPPTP